MEKMCCKCIGWKEVGVFVLALMAVWFVQGFFQLQQVLAMVTPILFFASAITCLLLMVVGHGECCCEECESDEPKTESKPVKKRK